ncbi:MAG: cupin domain-containing protein, partial [Moorea sp. SIO3I8]|nr:cupin domain-containing protein [Moorena sp. SIO3I8]
MSNQEKINKATAKNFQWGTGCEGWHLLTSEDLTIAEEMMPPQ